MSPDSDNEYFSDGLTEEIIADLSKLRALRVISRTSAMQLKGTTKDTKTIGRELNCQYVLEGSVRKAEDRLRITAQLIDAESDGHVWAEKYNGVLEDVFDVQEQVSRSIADALAVELSPEEERHIAERPIPNMVAYDYYLRARQGIWQFTAAGLDSAIRSLQKALEIVGENALLYRGMGYVHVQYVNAQIDVSPNHLVEAERYASKIQALDPASTDIPFLQGMVAVQRGQLHEAVRKLSRAYDGDPTDPDVAVWLSICLAFVGLMQKARHVAQQLEDIDPFGHLSPMVSPWLTFLEGRFARSAAEMQRVYADDPGNMMSAICYAHILGAARKTEEVSKVVTEAMRRDPDAAMTKGIVVFRHALRGEVDEVHRLMTEELQTMLGGDWQWCHLIADCYALIDSRDLALNWLEKAIDMGYTNYPFLSRHDPLLDSIRHEARFVDLMARVQRESEAIRAEIGD